MWDAATFARRDRHQHLAALDRCTQRLTQVTADHDAVDRCGYASALELIAGQLELRLGFVRLGLGYRELRPVAAIACASVAAGMSMATTSSQRSARRRASPPVPQPTSSARRQPSGTAPSTKPW